MVIAMLASLAAFVVAQEGDCIMPECPEGEMCTQVCPEPEPVTECEMPECPEGEICPQVCPY